MALSDTWLRKVNGKPRDRVLEKSDRDGMGVRISTKSKVKFQFRYRYIGKACRIDLGSYPATTLKEARELTLSYRKKLENGLNPKQVKQDKIQKNREAITVDKLFYLWYEAYCKNNIKHPENFRRCYEIHVSSTLGDQIFNYVTLFEWLTLFEQLARKYTTATTHSLAIVKSMTKWGYKRQLIQNKDPLDISPKHDLKMKSNARDRILTDNELKLFFSGLQNSRSNVQIKILLQLLLHFACRGAELRFAKKSHFDLKNKVWVVPPENHKIGHLTNKSIKRAIIDEAIPLLEFAFSLTDSEYAFSLGERPISKSTLAIQPSFIRKVCNRLGTPMEHWTIHDLRRTARTRLSKLTSSNIAEKILGHTLPGIQGVYDQYDYLEEQQIAYKAWWKEVDKIVGYKATNL
ncbi:DUF4102 domain-containing protein [Parashewanella curva]|uniref:DUF4102 domain-containing protein n=1 Tax=Parashewanella curva TaxID=2338552 RepID=A0A3L8PS38_9GAMM|nr:integrase family protein [Parashewanella curva]RLV58237.1 DUF4102 domain-containing protein [Parashewanella curva]